jgi:hypothetical protein
MSGYELIKSLTDRDPDIDPDVITPAFRLLPMHSVNKDEGPICEAEPLMAGSCRASYRLCEMGSHQSILGDLMTFEDEKLGVLRKPGGVSALPQSVEDEGDTLELMVSVVSRGDFQLDFSPDNRRTPGEFPMTMRPDVGTPHAASALAA